MIGDCERRTPRSSHDHPTIIERLIALTRDRGNMGFRMYVVDSLSYLGYVAALFVLKRVLMAPRLSTGTFLPTSAGAV